MPNGLVHFRTIPACIRCRQRKSRCDALLPSCAPCLNAGIPCTYIDPRSKEQFSRQHICNLEAQLRELEASALERGLPGERVVQDFAQTSPDRTAELSSPNGSNITYTEELSTVRSPDSQFVGASSGAHLARSVLEAVRQNGNIDPFLQSQQFATSSTVRSGQPSATPATRPSKDTAYGLIEIFFSNCQVQYPIISQARFRADVLKLYEAPDQLSRDSEVKIRFCLHMVLGIALLFLSRDNLEALSLAENYYESAMQDLMAVMKYKDLATIQCLLLIFLYSFFNSTRAPMWYLAGLSMRMCVDLGLNSEETLETIPGSITFEDQADHRRIFWVTYTLDRTLSIILDRPSSMRDGSISVKYPFDGTVDCLLENQAIHWIRLQQLQSDIMSHLLASNAAQRQANRDTVSLDWHRSIHSDLGIWHDEAQYLIDSDIHTADWWAHAYHTTLLLLLRPTLRMSPIPSLLAFYASSLAVIQLSFIQKSTNSLSLAWTSVHHQFTAGITLLFVIWNSTEVRAQAIKDWITVKSCLVQCGLVLEGLVGRWQSAVGAGEVLKRLAGITVDVLEKEMRGSKLQPTPVTNVVSSPVIIEQLGVAGSSLAANSYPEMGPLDTGMFPPMFGEDLTKTLYADPAEFYGFDYVNAGFLDEIDWSATESPLNFQVGQSNLGV